MLRLQFNKDHLFTVYILLHRQIDNGSLGFSCLVFLYAILVGASSTVKYETYDMNVKVKCYCRVNFFSSNYSQDISDKGRQN